MDDVSGVGRVEDVHDLDQLASGSWASDEPFAASHKLRIRPACVSDNLFGVRRGDAMLSDVLNVPGVPAEDIHYVNIYKSRGGTRAFPNLVGVVS